MDIKYINEFVVLVETGNFLEAAERLYISQSTLSKHIKSIETEFGEELFDRTTRKVELSCFGKNFYPFATRIVDLQNEYTTFLFQKFKTINMSLKLGSIPSMVQYGITDVVASFKKDNSNFSLSVRQDTSDKLEEMLRQNKCELAFIRQVDNSKNEFTEIPFTQDQLVAILPRSHPLANAKTIRLSQLENEDFLLQPRHSRPYNLCIKLCDEAGFKPHVTFNDRQIENIVDLVSREMGVSLLMKKLVLFLKNPNISIVEIVPNTTANISLCYKKGTALSVGTKYFIEYVTSKYQLKAEEV